VAFDGREIPQQFDPKAGAKAPALARDFGTAHSADMVSFSPVDELRSSNALQGNESLTRKLLELGRGQDVAETIGYRSITGKVVESERQVQTRKRRDDDLRFAIRTAREILDARLAEIAERRAEIAERLDAIELELDALDDLERLQAKGVIIDPNNPAHAAMLRRAGIAPDKIKPGDDIALLLLSRRLFVADERDALSREDAALKIEGDAITDLRDDADANPNDPAVLAQLAALGRTDSGSRILGGVAQSSVNDDLKATAADAASSGTAFRDLAREGAVETDAYLSRGDDLNWDAPAAPRPGSLPKPS